MEAERKKMEKKEISMYCQIREAIQNGELPRDFSLEKPGQDKKELKFADGAWDGIIMYHMSHSKKDIGLLTEALKECSASRTEKAGELLESYFNGTQGIIMLQVIDLLQEWIMEHQEELNIEKIYHFSRELMVESCNCECVKLGLAILELMSVEEDEELCEVVRTLGLSDEFTLFAMYLLRKRSNAMEELFQLAQKVHGWGRVFLVEEIQPQNEEMRHWLLEQGWRNEIMEGYSTLLCAQKGNLMQLLEQPVLTREDYEIAGDLLKALLFEEPFSGISALEDGEKALGRYLEISLSMAESIKDYDAIEKIRSFTADSTWQTKEFIINQCSQILEEKACKEAVETAMSDKRADDMAFDLASRLGLNYADQVMKRIREDFDNSYQLISLLMPNEFYVQELLELFAEKLPLEQMAVGPAKELGIGKEWREYDKLCYILQFLKDYPGKGKALILCGLNSPVIRNRNMALNVLEAWKEQGAEIAEDLHQTVELLKKTEVDNKIVERLTQF